MILTGGYAAVISIEPEPDNSPGPFTLKPLVDMNIDDVGIGVLQDMGNNTMDLPYGMVTFNETEALHMEYSGVEPLGADYVYEGWLIVDGYPVSTGVFSVTAGGMAVPSTVLVDAEDAMNAAMFVLTIEPTDDMDPSPSFTHYLAGSFGRAFETVLTVDHPAALGDDFMADAMGDYILETPSTAGIAGDYNQGIWFLDPSMGPGASLDLPVLPGGWMYEGWVAGVDGPVTTGRFLDPAMVDMDGAGPYAGPDGYPPFPGQDYIMPPMVLTDGFAAVISIEPEPDNDPGPFALKPLVDMNIDDVGAGVVQGMANNSSAFPTGYIVIGALAECVNDGDVNNSMDLTPEDALMTFQIYLELFTDPSIEEECSADCNADGRVTPGDALCIFQHYMSGACTCVDYMPMATRNTGLTIESAMLKQHSKSGEISYHITNLKKSRQVAVTIDVTPMKTDLAAFGFQVIFPSELMKVRDVEFNQELSGWAGIDAHTDNGILRIGAFDPIMTVPAGDTLTLATVIFDLKLQRTNKSIHQNIKLDIGPSPFKVAGHFFGGIERSVISIA